MFLARISLLCTVCGGDALSKSDLLKWCDLEIGDFLEILTYVLANSEYCKGEDQKHSKITSSPLLAAESIKFTTKNGLLDLLEKNVFSKLLCLT